MNELLRSIDFSEYTEVTQVRLLKLLHRMYKDTPPARLAYLRERLAMKAQLRACEELGQVIVIEGGRDCDGVQYSGRKHLIPATIAAYEDLYDSTAKWADGPFHFHVMKPSEAMDVHYASRDLTLEAFEDGHQHCLFASER